MKYYLAIESWHPYFDLTTYIWCYQKLNIVFNMPRIFL